MPCGCVCVQPTCRSVGSASPYGEYHASSGEIVGILRTMKEQINKDLGGIIEVEEAAVQAFQQTVCLVIKIDRIFMIVDAKCSEIHEC